MDNKERCRKYYYLHREKMIQQSKLYYQTHKEELKVEAREYRRKNRDKVNKWCRNYSQKIRLLVFKVLGNKCNNPDCLVSGGCQDLDCLQIDHIKGGGRKERQQFKRKEQYYKFIIQQIESGSTKYQLLCANCNTKKMRENKEWAG